MAKTSHAELDLVTVLEKAGEEDRQAIRERVAALEAELGGHRERIMREVKALHRVLAFLDLKLDGPKPRRQRAVTNNESSSEVADRIFKLLQREGPMPSDAIGKAIGISAKRAGIICHKSEWFRKTPVGEWAIA